MVTDTDFLIVYGTLRPVFDNPFAIYLRQYCQYVGDGTFQGQLFDIGNYPGALYQPKRNEKVVGSIYNLGLEKALIIRKLDEYEGISSEFQQPHEYIRTIIPVDSLNGLIHCWVYLYNWPTDVITRIDSGDYVDYLKK